MRKEAREQLPNQSKIDPYTGKVLRHGWGGNETLRNRCLKNEAEEQRERRFHPYSNLKFAP